MSTKSLVPTVLQKEFWHYSFKPQKKTLLICVLSLLMAVSIAMQSFFIPVGENLRIYFGFLASFLAGMLGGPIFALGYGFAKDIVGYMLFPSGAFFFGYTVTSMLGVFFYAMFFYRQKVTLLKVALCKFSINLFINVILGSVWSAMLFSNGFIYYAMKSVTKNVLMFPIEVFLLWALYKAVAPTLIKMDLIEDYSTKDVIEDNENIDIEVTEDSSEENKEPIEEITAEIQE